ncbi:MAG: hypothetical protein M3280_02090 [Actinomycetota bacterium]|nr:hypothetical protein [Actinomycetota bacterium]
MRRTAVVVPALTLLALAACGDSSPRTTVAPTPHESEEVRSVLARKISAAGREVQSRGSAAMLIRMTSTLPERAGGGLMAGVGRGEFDFKSKTGTMFMKMTGPPGLPAMSQRIEAIMKFPDVYMKSSLFSKLLPEGARWITFDLQQMGEKMGIDMRGLMQLDASSNLVYLEGVRDVERVGVDRVRGVSTVQYSAFIDFKSLAETVPEDLRPSIERLMDLMASDRIPVEAWIDSKGVLRRERTEMQMYMPGLPESTTMSMDTIYYDFGRPVRVDVPAPRRVLTLRELMELSGELPAPGLLPSGTV